MKNLPSILYCDKVISGTDNGDQIGVYYYDENEKEVLIASMEPTIGRAIVELYNKMKDCINDVPMFKSFMVSSVCREDFKEEVEKLLINTSIVKKTDSKDIIQGKVEKAILLVDDNIMEHIARKMGDVMQELYWDALRAQMESIIGAILNSKEEK